MTKPELSFLTDYEATIASAIQEQGDKIAEAEERGPCPDYDYHVGCADGLRLALQTLHDLIDTLPKGGDTDGT